MNYLPKDTAFPPSPRQAKWVKRVTAANMDRDIAIAQGDVDAQRRAEIQLNALASIMGYVKPYSLTQ